MSSRLKTIMRIESAIMIVLSVSMIPPLLIAIYNGEQKSIYSFLVVILLSFFAGMFLNKNFSHSQYRLKNRDGFLIVALAWALASFFGAMPFYFSGSIPSFADSFFESCSGFTTTGASILTDIEVLPRSILFWRSFTHWLGGMGIIVFITALVPAFGLNGQIVANAETKGPTKDKITAKYSQGAKAVYLIYIAMTVIETILLKLCGLSLYDALVHTFGTVGTGGLSTYNTSISHFGNIYVEIIIAIFMLLAAINFNLYYVAVKRGIKHLFADEETKFFLFVVFAATTLIGIYNFFFNSFKDLGRIILNAFFQVVSIISTTGYMTNDFDSWPTFSRMIIFCLFFIGGCASSTGGGIKCIRVLGAIKLIKRGITHKIHPNIISPVTLNGREMSNETAIRISNFIFTYIFITSAGMILLSLDGQDFMTNLSAAASCIGNIGPGFNMVGPTMNYAFFSDFSKYVCSFLMITGRLELYTVLVLFSKYYHNPNRTK